MDHPLIPVITLHLFIVEKKTFYCNDHKITEFGITDKNSSTAYIVLYIDRHMIDDRHNGLTHDFWTRTGGWEFDRSHGAGTSSPSHWQQVEEQAPKPVGWTMCFLLVTLVSVQKLCVDINVYIYMYVHSLYEFCYRSYIQRECHSVLAKLRPITFYRGVRGSWAECHFLARSAAFLRTGYNYSLTQLCLSVCQDWGISLAWLHWAWQRTDLWEPYT